MRFVRLKMFKFGLFVAAVISASGSVLAQYGEVLAPPEELKTGFDSITTEQAEQWLNLLAGPKFAGRGTGQVGFNKAAHWVAGKVAEFGLEPKGDNETYFQFMPIIRRLPDIAECKIVGPDGFEISGTDNLGFERYTDKGEVGGAAVFASFKGDAPSLPEGIELRDKIVIYWADQDAVALVPRLLASQRPAAVLRVIETTPESVPQTLFAGRRSRSTSVSGTISSSAAASLAKKLGVKDDWNAEPSVAETETQISLRLRLLEENAGAPNVVAYLEGSDPELKKEFVVIGSHLDHLGTNNGLMFPGADDNGSGSTAVLSIARAMAENPVKPKRSVLFIWFTAEEVGLLGSRYYTENPTLPLKDMTCMFNIDMVGRNEDQGAGDADADNEGHIHLIGSLRGETQLHDIVLEANKHVGFEFELDMESVWNRSDQVNFYNKGVPVAFLFGGFHPDYHQPSDKPAKINFKKVASAAKLYYLAVNKAANHGRFEMKK